MTNFPEYPNLIETINGYSLLLSLFYQQYRKVIIYTSAKRKKELITSVGKITERRFYAKSSISKLNEVKTVLDIIYYLLTIILLFY